MRLTIAAVGRLKTEAERGLAERYVDRTSKAGAALGFSIAVREIGESRSPRAPDRRRDEAAGLARSVPDGALIVALDEHGETLSSEAFARKLQHWQGDGTADVAFLIGGADGLDPALVASARMTLAFGAMTWPHQLVRIMLAEQIYRAVTILSRHPYHR